MLKPGVIPDEEPLLRVGIILPEDKQDAVTLSLDDVSTSILIINEQKLPLIGNEIEVTIVENTLKLKGYVIKEPITNVKISHEPGKTSINTYPVIAGRGFHWAKHIQVKLPHNIELSVIDNSLILINELPLETYLACVATSEMGADCPESFIEAQTIVARSWMLANVEQKHTSLGFDVCNDDCCQRFQGVNNLTEKSEAGAMKTKGQVLIFEDKICDARYSKSCGGIMEKYENLWEGPPLPYMQNIPDAVKDFDVNLSIEKEMKRWVESKPKSFCSPYYIPEENLKKYLGNVDEEGQYFRWIVKTTQEEIVENLNDKHRLGARRVISLIPIKRAGSGRMLELKINYIDDKELSQTKIIYKDYNIRQVLHKMFLYSSACIIEEVKSKESGFPEEFIFKGAGWGHGAGLCQIGGLGMSLKGYRTKEILYHYYPGSELKKIYS